MTVQRKFLGSGLAFPLRVDPRGGIERADGERLVQQSIWVILATAKGQLQRNPRFGCGIHDFVFSANTPANRAELLSWLMFAATGHPPYAGDSVTDILVRLATEPPDLTGLPDELADLKENRPKAFAAALEAVGGEKGIGGGVVAEIAGEGAVGGEVEERGF